MSEVQETAINSAIRLHEEQVPWEYQDLAKVCYEAFDLFNAAFFEGRLPPCLIQFDTANYKKESRYRPGTNGIGAQCEILLNVKHLHRPLYELLGSLLHQLVHQWQEMQGEGGERTYHKKAFLAKSEEVGIPCPKGFRCEIREYAEPFWTEARKLGRDLEAMALPGEKTVAVGASTLKKWRCGCTNIWAAKSVRAKCEECGTYYQKVEIVGKGREKVPAAA